MITKNIVKKVVVEKIETKTTYEIGDTFLFKCYGCPLNGKVAYVKSIGTEHNDGLGHTGYHLESIPDFNHYWINGGYEDDPLANMPLYLGKFEKIESSYGK